MLKNDTCSSIYFQVTVGEMVQCSNALKILVAIDQTVQFMHADQICRVLYLDACKHYRSYIYSRNKLDFWNVHGIMNSFGLLQSKYIRASH